MSVIVHAVNVLCSLLPVRETCGLRRALLRLGGVKVGNGTRITHGVRFHGKYVQIGDRVWIGTGTTFVTTVKAMISIGDDVDIAPGCHIISGSHLIGSAIRRAGEGIGKDVVIERGTWIGAGSLILPGCHIGESCIVAAGAVVREGVYPGSVMLAGNPAVIKKILS